MFFLNSLKEINRKRNTITRMFILNIRIFFYKRKRGNIKIGNEYKNVILWPGKGIGDCIILSSLISIIRSNGFKVTVITTQHNNFLFEDIIHIDNILPIAKLKNITNDYDILIDPYDNSDKIASRIKGLLRIKPKISIGFNGNLYDINIRYHKYNSHFTQRFTPILKELDINKSREFQYKLNIPSYIEHQTQSFLDKYHQDKVIILSPFASNKTRSLNKKQVTSILKHISTKKNCLTIIIGSKHQLSEITDLISPKVITPPEKSFLFSMSLIKNSDLVISVDTSAVHVSNCFNKNLLAIYNNRTIDNKFENNSVFSPNYKNSKQFFTTLNTKSELGDDVSSFDTSLLHSDIDKVLS